MKCFSAIVIIAYGVLAIGADALGVHRHRDDEKDNMPHRRRISSGEDIFGHAAKMVAAGRVAHPFEASMETRLGVMERVNSWLEQHADQEEVADQPQQQQQQQQGSLRRLHNQKNPYKVHIHNNRYKVDVRFVQIKHNRTVPTIGLKAYRESVRQVNRDYRSSGFTFRLVETVAVVDPERFNCSFFFGNDFDVGQAYRQGNATMLNVFLCDTGPSAGGFAYQPFYLPFGGDFEKAVDAVFLKEKNLNIYHILTHEIGHWLGLDHPDWSGCDFPGDGVDDTPYSEYTDNQDCAVVLDTCPDKPGVDPIDNFMSYTRTCGKSFTNGQQTRMRAVYETYRLHLNETDACEFELQVTFDDKPEQVKIFVEANDWYDYLIVHGEKYQPNETYTLSSYFVEGQGSLSIQGVGGGDSMGAGTSVTLTLLDSNGERYTLASVAGSSTVNQELLMVNFTVPSGCSFVNNTDNRSARRQSSSRRSAN